MDVHVNEVGIEEVRQEFSFQRLPNGVKTVPATISDALCILSLAPECAYEAWIGGLRVVGGHVR